jgi:hypothetical protein
LASIGGATINNEQRIKIRRSFIVSKAQLDFREAPLQQQQQQHSHTQLHRLTMWAKFLVLTTAVCSVSAFVVQTNAPAKTFRPSNTRCHSAFDTRNMWNGGNAYGKGQFKYYKDFDSWMGVFPEPDRLEYPEVFNLPKGVYEVKLNGPLGIVFEEIEQGKGLFVKDLVEGGNAANQGTVELDDVLIGLTAVKVVGAKFERRLLPTWKFDFDTMVSCYLHSLYLCVTLISLAFLRCILLTIVFLFSLSIRRWVPSDLTMIDTAVKT